MQRRTTLVLFVATLLAGCGDSGTSNTSSSYGAMQAEAPAPMMGLLDGDKRAADVTTGGVPQSGESYIYDHALTLSMDSGHIKARFERARDRCQNDAALKCKVMAASFQVFGNPDAPVPIANLSVALPHDSIAPFEASLVAPLPDEPAGEVFVQSRSTTAQNVTNQVKDLDRRLAQLVDYRERMTVLSKRSNASTDDLIKIEGEVSKTQSDIEQLEGQKRDLAERIAKENMNISFQAQSTVGDAFQPVRNVWQSALRILGNSTGAALGVLIGALPWLPILALLFFAIRWLWRRMRRKPA